MNFSLESSGFGCEGRFGKEPRKVFLPLRGSFLIEGMRLSVVFLDELYNVIDCLDLLFFR